MDDLYEGSLEWDANIENDSAGFQRFKPGIYNFTVDKFERGSFNGSEKMCACGKAIITMTVKDASGNATTVTDGLIMHKKMEWKLSEFFRAIGQKKHGEKLRMDWNKVIGASGKLKLKNIEGKTKRDDGSSIIFSNVDKYFDPGDPTPVTKVGIEEEPPKQTTMMPGDRRVSEDVDW